MGVDGENTRSGSVVVHSVGVTWSAGYRGGITVCTYTGDRVSDKAGADGCELSLSFRDTFSRKHQVRISVPMHAITATRAHQGYV